MTFFSKPHRRRERKCVVCTTRGTLHENLVCPDCRSVLPGMLTAAIIRGPDMVRLEKIEDARRFIMRHVEAPESSIA